MAFTPTTPVTGAAVVGKTNPTYTITEGDQPSLVSRQWYVSAVGGTQMGVDIHTREAPFTVAFFRPGALAPMPGVGPNGLLGKVTRDVWKLVFRKGGTPSVGSDFIPFYKPDIIRVELDFSTLRDDVQRGALISMAFGFLFQNSAAIESAISNGTVK